MRHWKADPSLKQIPFIVYTATYTEAEDERLALRPRRGRLHRKTDRARGFSVEAPGGPGKRRIGRPRPPRDPVGDETRLLKVYSETLIRKLEEKTLLLEEANRALQRDIAERKRTEENLRDSEERYRATFEHAAVGIAHVSLEGQFLRVNDKFCEITGYSRPELLQKTFIEMTAPEDRPPGDEARRDMLAGTRGVYSAEKRYQRRNGRQYWVTVVTTLFRDPGGSPRYFISVIDDITERKVLQQQFLRAQRMESIGTLAGGIAHDLNNLLAPIVMGVELLRMKVSDADSRELIETMAHSAQRGTNLVKQVLSFARGVEGARVSIHLSHLTREIQEFVRSTFPKNIALRADVSKDTWLVQGDPTQLNQVLLNLCVNARDAMPDGGTLSVSTKNLEVGGRGPPGPEGLPPGRYVQLDIADTGTGILPEVRERIFEPFFTTKDPEKGTGLGLSTVLTIVRSHGGRISVESEPGRGSIFRIVLPAQTDSSSEGGPPPALDPPPCGHGELILVVDDDAGVLSITRQTLETFGYRVLGTGDGARAIALYATRRAEISAVLVDMMMPVMDGPTLIKALREISPDVRIVATSGLYGNQGAATSIGVADFLLKPYTADALLGVLHRVVARPG